MKNLRLYLDYNATSPLAAPVKELLISGDFPFANPSSQHTSGKKSRHQINLVSEYFQETYALKDFSVLYHSGATEGINLFCRQLKKDDLFIGFHSDHPAVVAQENFFKQKSIKSFWLNPEKSGDFPLAQVQKILEQNKEKNIFLNFTWVHNETGVVWPLKILDELTHPHLYIHVDAVQSVGKIENFLSLGQRPVMYTFSGHKFGSLKSIGFSFVKKDFQLVPLFWGGGQQRGLRAGTENPLAVMSLKLAHEFWRENFFPEALKKLKEKMIFCLKEILKEDVLIVGESAHQQNLNTVDFIHKKMRADLLLTKFDLNGVDVSSGSACSSGQIQSSETLIAMGLGEFSKNSIRLSFSSFEVAKENIILESLKRTLVL